MRGYSFHKVGNMSMHIHNKVQGLRLTSSSMAVQVHIYSLPDLEPLTTEALGGEVIPRSVLFADFEGVPYLLTALGDGQLLNFHVDASSGVLSERKKISLGTKPITLRRFRSNGASHVFAASDRPTIIYSSNKKLLYSNLNEDEVCGDLKQGFIPEASSSLCNLWCRDGAESRSDDQ